MEKFLINILVELLLSKGIITDQEWGTAYSKALESRRKEIDESEKLLKAMRERRSFL